MYAASLRFEDRKRYMRYAVYSSCFGAVLQMGISESSLFIIYASRLGADQFLSLMTTSVIPLLKLFLLIPFAYIMEKTGLKGMLIPSYFIGMAGMTAASASGFFPERALVLFVGGIFLYAVSISVHSAGWFALQRYIIPPGERGAHIGRLRYSWQITVSLFLLIASLVVDENSPLIRMQLIIFIGTLLIIGRIVFISRIPERPPRGHTPPFWVMLHAAWKNRPLLRMSLFMAGVNFLIASTVPAGFAFLKYELALPDNLNVLFSVCTGLATIGGFIAASRIIDKFPAKTMFLIVQGLFAGVNCLLLTVRTPSVPAHVLVLVLLCAAAACYAFCSVVISTSMMGLVKENNINISIALSFGLTSGGVGLSRMLSGIAAQYAAVPAGINISVYHLLFLGFGLGMLVLLLAVLRSDILVNR